LAHRLGGPFLERRRHGRGVLIAHRRKIRADVKFVLRTLAGEGRFAVAAAPIAAAAAAAAPTAVTAFAIFAAFAATLHGRARFARRAGRIRW